MKVNRNTCKQTKEKKKIAQKHASGTPPTLVLTVRSPQLAASKMAMQKASVRELQERTRLTNNAPDKAATGSAPKAYRNG